MAGFSPAIHALASAGKTWMAGPRPTMTMEVDLNQYQSFVGDAGGLAFVFGAEDHLVMRRAAWNHREAVLLRIHGDVGNHRTVCRQHLADHIIQLFDTFRAQSDRMEAVGELDEIRQRRAVTFRIA